LNHTNPSQSFNKISANDSTKDNLVKPEILSKEKSSLQNTFDKGNNLTEKASQIEEENAVDSKPKNDYDWKLNNSDHDSSNSYHRVFENEVSVKKHPSVSAQFSLKNIESEKASRESEYSNVNSENGEKVLLMNIEGSDKLIDFDPNNQPDVSKKYNFIDGIKNIDNLLSNTQSNFNQSNSDQQKIYKDEIENMFSDETEGLDV